MEEDDDFKPKNVRVTQLTIKNPRRKKKKNKNKIINNNNTDNNPSKNNPPQSIDINNNSSNNNVEKNEELFYKKSQNSDESFDTEEKEEDEKVEEFKLVVQKSIEGKSTFQKFPTDSFNNINNNPSKPENRVKSKLNGSKNLEDRKIRSQQNTQEILIPFRRNNEIILMGELYNFEIFRVFYGKPADSGDDEKPKYLVFAFEINLIKNALEESYRNNKKVNKNNAYQSLIYNITKEFDKFKKDELEDIKEHFLNFTEFYIIDYDENNNKNKNNKVKKSNNTNKTNSVKKSDISNVKNSINTLNESTNSGQNITKKFSRPTGGEIKNINDYLFFLSEMEDSYLYRNYSDYVEEYRDKLMNGFMDIALRKSFINLFQIIGKIHMTKDSFQKREKYNLLGLLDKDYIFLKEEDYEKRDPQDFTIKFMPPYLGELLQVLNLFGFKPQNEKRIRKLYSKFAPEVYEYYLHYYNGEKRERENNKNKKNKISFSLNYNSGEKDISRNIQIFQSSDYWSMGILMYECIYQSIPIQINSFENFSEDLNEETEYDIDINKASVYTLSLINKCLFYRIEKESDQKNSGNNSKVAQQSEYTGSYSSYADKGKTENVRFQPSKGKDFGYRDKKEKLARYRDEALLNFFKEELQDENESESLRSKLRSNQVKRRKFQVSELYSDENEIEEKIKNYVGGYSFFVRIWAKSLKEGWEKNQK